MPFSLEGRCGGGVAIRVCGFCPGGLCMAAGAWASRVAAFERGVGLKYRYSPAAGASGRLAGVCFSVDPVSGAEAACGDSSGLLGCADSAVALPRSLHQRMLAAGRAHSWQQVQPSTVVQV